MFMIKLSIVIPAFNSQGTIGQVISRVEETINNLGDSYTHEIIVVNDSSRDNTLDVCKGLALSDKRVKVISFSKNFGQHSAIMAGFRASTGDYTICLDDDLQTPPEEIGSLVYKLESGKYDVVYAYYNDKKHSGFRNLGSRINDLMAEYLINKPKNLKVSSYFIARKFVIDEIIKYDKPYPYILGLILRITDNIGGIPVEHSERKIGKSNYTLKKLIKLWLNGFTNFSVRPLRVSSITGFILAIISAVYSLAIMVRKLVNPEIQLGWTSIMVTVIFIGAVQLMSIGLLGEYVGRIYLSINKTPQYTIKEVYGEETEKERGVIISK